MGRADGYAAKRVDNNQAAIVEAFRRAGADVIHLHAVGRGVPDLIVSTEWEMWLVEVKQPGKKLNKRQVDWWQNWEGKCPHVIRTPEAAELLVRRSRRGGSAGYGFRVLTEEDD